MGVNTTGAAPAATNLFEVLQPSTTANSVGIYSRHLGNPVSGTAYAFQAIANGAGVNNVAAYLSATGASGTNYSLIVPSGGGNVGIGTTSPGALLDVNGDFRVGISSTSGLLIQRFSSALTDVPGSTSGMQLIGPLNAHVVYDIQGNDANDGFYVRIPTSLASPTVVDQTAFVVKAGGNVGVGVASPSVKLDVNGTIRTGLNGTDGQLQIYSEQGATDYTYTINPHAAATQNVVLTLPPDDGAANQVLQTDGSGALSWTTPTTGTVTSVATGTGLTGGTITSTGTLSLANMAANTIKGNNTGASAAPTDITVGANQVLGRLGANLVPISFGTAANTVAWGDHTHAQLHNQSHAMTSTSDHTATAWRAFYSNGSGNVTELALGTSGQVLTANGVSAAPSWTTPTTGTVTSVATSNGISGGTITSTGTISLGGTLTSATTITQGANAMIFNMNSTGDFEVRDNGATCLFVRDDGNVGIGTNAPTQKLEISGRVKSNGINETSDLRLKKDIVNIADALQKVNSIRGVNYYWKKDEYPDKGLDDRKQMGVIAQEVERVVPEVVITDSEGYKSVEYSKMVGLLIEAVKDLSAISEEQKNQINALKSENNDLKSEVQKINRYLDIQSQTK